jgi:hypothetical protein
MQWRGATEWEVIGFDENEPIGGRKSASPNGGGGIRVQERRKINRGCVCGAEAQRACGQCGILGVAERQRLAWEAGAKPRGSVR